MNKKEEKIAFCCPWGINSAKLLYNFKLLTPNNDGTIIQQNINLDFLLGVASECAGGRGIALIKICGNINGKNETKRFV